MSLVVEVLRVVSILSFLFYGIACALGGAMEAEFERFGLARFRVLTGVLEILGALGLLVSYAVPALLPFAAGGLSLLMVLGVLARVRVRDPLLAMVPALLLMAANGYLAVAALLDRAPV